MTPAVMLQSSNRKRARIRIAIKQNWFAPAKVRYPRTPDSVGEIPIAIDTILFQFVHAMMSAYMLQV